MLIMYFLTVSSTPLLVLIFLWCASVHVMQGLSGLQSMLRKDQSFRGAMRPVRLVMTAANAKTGALFCLVECEEEADVCKSMDQDVVLLQMHCTGKAHGIIKLNMSTEDQAKGAFQDGGVLVEGEESLPDLWRGRDGEVHAGVYVCVYQVN